MYRDVLCLTTTAATTTHDIPKNGMNGTF